MLINDSKEKEIHNLEKKILINDKDCQNEMNKKIDSIFQMEKQISSLDEKILNDMSLGKKKDNEIKIGNQKQIIKEKNEEYNILLDSLSPENKKNKHLKDVFQVLEGEIEIDNSETNDRIEFQKIEKTCQNEEEDDKKQNVKLSSEQRESISISESVDLNINSKNEKKENDCSIF